MKKILVTLLVAWVRDVGVVAHGIASSNDSRTQQNHKIDAVFSELLEMQKELDLSSIPKIDRRLDKI